MAEVQNTEKTPEAKPKKEKKPSKDKATIEKLQNELNEKNELLLRTAAEFDNYKKRTERERVSVASYAKAETVKKLLPVFDNVDRALSVSADSAEYQKGIEMIVKQLTKAVEDLGLEAIGAEGETFNPELHEAVMHCEDDALPENSIVQVLQKGYKIGDTVVRPPMVKVAN